MHPEDQQEDNYTYDEIGNLSKDLAEDIERIEWTVSGKVYAVIRKANSGKADLYFSYDAMGNRISKKSIDALGKVHTTYYFRDASGNTMTTYEKQSTSTFTPSEYHIYGSSRLGMYSPVASEGGINAQAQVLFGDLGAGSYTVGNRTYEFSDHLGNVHLVLNDMQKTQSATEYYPFGMVLQAYSPSEYRYGFNGMEKDDEWSGSGNSYDFGARIYDSRLGRWMAIDPLWNLYTGLSPYNFVANTPIQAKDPSGKLIIFINGLWGPVGNINSPKEKYWTGRDKNNNKSWIPSLQDHWSDYESRFYDGSVGGQGNLGIDENLDANFRINQGKTMGYRDAKSIIANLSENETIKFVTNSQGAAFQRGFSQGLMKYVNEQKTNNFAQQVNISKEIEGLKEEITYYETMPPKYTPSGYNINKSYTEEAEKKLKIAQEKFNVLKTEYTKLNNVKIEIVVDLDPYQATNRDPDAENHYYVLSDGTKEGFAEKFIDIEPVNGAEDVSKKDDGTPVMQGHHSSFANPSDLPKP